MRPDARLLALILVYFTVFVDILGVGLLIPVLPFLVGTRPNPDAFAPASMFNLKPGAAMALTLVSYNGAQFVSVLVNGPLSDRFGRVPLLLSSTIGGAIGYALQGVTIAVGNFPLFIAARLLTGLFGGSRAAAVAYIADSSSPAERPRLMGLLALAVTLGFQIGPVVGGSLGSIHLALPCYSASGVSAVGTCLVYCFVAEPGSAGGPRGHRGGGAGDVQPSYKTAFALNLVLSFCTGFWIMSQLLGFALLMPERFNFDPNKVGLASLGDGLMILCGNPCYMYLVKRVRIPVIAAIGCAMMAMISICPFMNDLAPLFVFRYVCAIGGPMAIPSVTAIVSIIAPAKRRGAWTGMTMGVQNLARTVAPAVLGVTFDADYRVPFLISGGMMLVAFTACVALIPMVPSAHLAKPAGKPAEDSDSEYPAAERSEVAIEMDEASDGQAQSSEPDELSVHAEALLVKLRAQQNDIRLKLRKAKDGQGESEVVSQHTPEQRAHAKNELNDWLVILLESHGWVRWPEHLDGIKMILFNSFPKLRMTSTLDKLSDLIEVFGNHISMAERYDMFHGADDLGTYRPA
ncbi:unnamed protein product [Prorocentrum cordatum]|uniref:Major facilitator superfamily (MFS) profile domain-containing protein n=1 Tax=Prorocentrum cordatum TaxID=2364126 RepID=A0ABN9S8P7_9DINO|nr:unnamed protein product [Polarella glacialis]